MQKKFPLTVEGFIARLKNEGFRCLQIHASLARRNYTVGDFVLWCSSQGHSYLIERAEYDHAELTRTRVNWVASEMLYYEDGAEHMLAEIRKRVKPGAIPVPESEPEGIVVQAPWSNKRMEITNAREITVTDEKPTVDFRKKPEAA